MPKNSLPPAKVIDAIRKMLAQQMEVPTQQPQTSSTVLTRDQAPTEMSQGEPPLPPNALLRALGDAQRAMPGPDPFVLNHLQHGAEQAAMRLGPNGEATGPMNFTAADSADTTYLEDRRGQPPVQITEEPTVVTREKFQPVLRGNAQPSKKKRKARDR